jgi:hypothetical protein
MSKTGVITVKRTLGAVAFALATTALLPALADQVFVVPNDVSGGHMNIRNGPV